jgi:hypothetical protein
VLKHKLFFVIAAWAVVIGFGLHTLLVYKGKAGSPGQTPEIWPVNGSISLFSAKPTLLVFAHPRCPCTKATLGEIELLAAQAKGCFVPTILFYEPDEVKLSESEAWTNSVLIKEAQSIPGVKLIFDPKGELARQFGAETSGHTVLYRPDGKLLFSGGITGSRGHLGENAGFDSLLRILTEPSAQPDRVTGSVFGCGLFDQCTTTPLAKRH